MAPKARRRPNTRAASQQPAASAASVRTIQREHNIVAEPIRSIPNEPPTQKTSVPVNKIVRLTGTPSGTATVAITGTLLATFKGFPTSGSSFWIQTVKVWSYGGVTDATSNPSVILTDVRSGRIFADNSATGNLPAKAGFRFSELDRITPFTKSGTTVFADVSITGKEYIIDVNLLYVDS